MNLNTGDRIMLLRRKHNESQAQLANAIDITQRAVARWETGYNDPSAYAIREICKHYKVSADWLLGLEDKNEAY